MASSLQQIANWKSFQNPLEHCVGENAICPALVARGQEDEHAMMILIADGFKGERINLRERYRTTGCQDGKNRNGKAVKKTV